MELSDDEKMMVVEGHALSIVNAARSGYGVSPSRKADMRDMLKRMTDLLADPVNETPKA